MKVINSINKLYNTKISEYEKLKKNVDELFRDNKKTSWHYFSRIKNIESLALKLETGRFKVNAIDDIFACTLVVENLNEIKTAIEVIENRFFIKYKKPQEDRITHKDSYSFPFDDLRLYVTIKQPDYLPDNHLSSLVFEIQIKTFLQHAWTIATHDLIYKSNTINWGKERVAYQIKAMLEQAELAISGAEELSKLQEIAKNNSNSIRLNKVRDFLIDVFPEESLPSDLMRLSGIIISVQKFFQIDLEFIRRILEKETKDNRGVLTLDLSPYGIIIQSLINQEPKVFEAAFKKNVNGYSKGFFLPDEIDSKSITFEDVSKIVRC